MITEKWPHYGQDEVDAVKRVLLSGKVNYWTGEEGRLFEKEYAASLGVKYAIALANGTVALEAALCAMDIGPGDDVIVPSRTFIASASCAVMRGARPVVADIDADSQNITAETVRPVLTPKTKAIIAVHLAGWPCDMDSILALAREHNIKVIEDCAQAHGATYKGRPVGSFGDAAAFSFCQDKIISTGGEGGLLTTNDYKIWDKVWSFKDHGKSYDAVYKDSHPIGFKWLHRSFGTNWRITELQAAIGRIQLKKLSDWIKKRQVNALMFNECFSQIPSLRVTIPASWIGHSYYKYYVFVRPEKLKQGWNQNRIIGEINSEGVFCQSGSCSEIYLENAFQENKLFSRERLPVAKKLGDTSLMFLVHPTLDHNSINYVIDKVTKIVNSATR